MMSRKRWMRAGSISLYVSALALTACNTIEVSAKTSKLPASPSRTKRATRRIEWYRPPVNGRRAAAAC